MRRILPMLIALCVCLASTAEAQVGELQDCPVTQYRPGFETMPRWTKDHAGTNPVIPELRRMQTAEAISYIRRVLADPVLDPTTEPDLIRARVRINALFVQQAFTPPGTMMDKVAVEPPASFLPALRSVKLVEKIVPCGKTTVWFPSEAAPDRVMPDGSRIPWARMWSNEAVVLGFCEVGVKTEAGECGVRVIATSELEITEGHQMGQRQTGWFYLICGNLDFSLDMLREGLTQTSEVRPEKPLQPEPDIVTYQPLLPKDLPPLLVSRPTPEPAPVPVVEKKRGKVWIPCVSSYTWAACAAAAILPVIRGRAGPDGNNTPSKTGSPGSR